MRPPSKLLDWYQINASSIAGIDEAGRGPLAGPVVAAAVILESEDSICGLNDSKKLTELKRELLFDKITKSARAFGFGIVSSTQIDQMNILRASLFAMKLALEEMQSKIDWPIKGALVDGSQKAPLPDSVVQITIVGGDATWPVIMAASILAKVTRDRLMLRYAEQFPEYGFAKHKGYGTAAHLEALYRYGPTPIHRWSFAPVRKAGELGGRSQGAS